jgi:toxin ParE1/3/4
MRLAAETVRLGLQGRFAASHLTSTHSWSAFAVSDRDAIFTFIEADNPSAAILVDGRIVAAVRRLTDFPASGRVGRIAGTRELVISGTPYVAAYAVTEPTVRILPSFMGRRNGQTLCQLVRLRARCLKSTGRWFELGQERRELAAMRLHPGHSIVLSSMPEAIVRGGWV